MKVEVVGPRNKDPQNISRTGIVRVLAGALSDITVLRDERGNEVSV